MSIIVLYDDDRVSLTCEVNESEGKYVRKFGIVYRVDQIKGDFQGWSGI